MNLKCPGCHRDMLSETTDVSKFLRDEESKGIKYIECPHCGRIQWLNNLK